MTVSARAIVEALGGHGPAAKCPAHEDKQASLSVSENAGKILVKCHAGCNQLEVISALRDRGLWPTKMPVNGAGAPRSDSKGKRTLEATYDYTDERGQLLYQVVRYRYDDGSKTFRQRQPKADGSWQWSTRGLARTLYRLPEVTEALDAGRLVLIVEGEKDADRLADLGFVATTNTGGAGTGKWTPNLTDIMARAEHVAILPDQDEPGRKHADAIARAISAAGVPDIRIVNLPAPRKDISDYLETIDPDERADAVRRLVRQAPPESGEAQPQAITEAEADDWILDKHERICKQAIPNIWRALRLLGVELWYDEFAARTMFQRADSKPEPVEDHHCTRWWVETDQAFRFRPPEKLWNTIILDRARDRAVHPVRDYLDQLQWDGTPRIGSWLIDLAGAPDTDYARAVARMFLLAAVRRVRQPGCKFDELLILESPEGAQKSSAMAALCPRADWFSDDLPLSASTKEVIERTAGKWLIEIADLQGMRKREVEACKAFLSRQHDRARLSYGYFATERPRQCVFVGTTNENAYLQSMTGNRRFWPVRILEFNAEQVADMRDQLWAEAAHYEARGESIRLHQSLWADAGMEQEQRRQVDEWERILDECLGNIEGTILTEDVWGIVGAWDRSRRSQADNVRLGNAMTSIGFERSRRRIGGGRTYVYQRGADCSRTICVKDGLVYTAFTDE